uniref:Bicarbonate transporter-like transmembrane domain-containing protein n=1 Tax=Globodera rostochiensis TaxID=31243 RepID=A0A914I1I7_GLORO
MQSIADGNVPDGGFPRPRFLLQRTQSLIAPRNFHSEVRGLLDVEHLLDKCAILLHVTETLLEDVVLKMVEEKPEYHDGPAAGEDVAIENKNNNNRLEFVSFRQICDKLFVSIDDTRTSLTSSEFALRVHLQGVLTDEHLGVVEDQRWLVLYCSIERLCRPRVSFARLATPTNFGVGLADVRFVVLVIAPLQQRETKSAAEIARTFGSLMADPRLYHELAIVATERQFVAKIRQKAYELSIHSKHIEKREEKVSRRWFPGRGLILDLQRRLPFYKSDFLDGIADLHSFQKTISSTAFLYVIVLPTAIALGMLNEEHTHGKITVSKAILGQWIGGLVFGLFGGQLFLVLLTSPPVSIYITVVERLSHSLGYNFFQLYSGIGIWCCFYLLLFAVFEVSKVMKYAKRSLEEMFSMFIACTLTIESAKAALASLRRAFMPHCLGEQQHQPGHPQPPHPAAPPLPPPAPNHANQGWPSAPIPDANPAAAPLPPHLDPLNCNRSVGLLFVLLMLGTAWTAITLANFRKSPFLGKRKRELVSDYALPLAVVLMTVVANLIFGDVPQETFRLSAHNSDLTLGEFWQLPLNGQMICCVLGFPLAILVTMDQMIVTETVDNSQNNLRKGPAANWDFLVVALLNVPLSLFGLPWMHAALPQSFLHLKAQADVEDCLVDGVPQQIIVKNRECRLATLFAHGLIVPTYFFALHILRLFPTFVFCGVFLFLALSSTIGNELCQRTILFLTEQRSYPPAHYVRRVPQRTIHLFTVAELLQLGLLLSIGHFPWPVIRLLFPIVLIVLIPIRALLFPKLFNKKDLEVLDGTH